MAGSVNKVILVGNIGRDPEVRSFSNGDKVCNLSIATSESWKDKATGERKEKTEWHRVSIRNQGLVTVAEKYLKKGSKVYIEGQLETRKYDKDGVEHYATDIVIKAFSGQMQILSSSDKGDADEGGHTEQRSSGSSQQSSSAGGRQNDIDDDIPFN